MYGLCDALCIYKIKRDINSALTISFFNECLYRNPMFFPKSLGFFLCKNNLVMNQKAQCGAGGEI